MACGVNKAIILGNLGNDPDMRYTSSGSAVANITIATSETWKDKESGEKQEKTEWHRVSAFGKLAEIIGEYLRKGSQVYIEGRIQTRKWQDKDGNDRYTTEIIANELQMLGGKNNNDEQPQQNATPQDSSPAVASNDFDDDIPFNKLKHEYCY